MQPAPAQAEDSPAATTPSDAPRLALHVAIAHATSLFIGAFCLLNLLGDLITPGFDANAWWIDFRPLRQPLARLILAPASVLLIGHALKPHASSWRWNATLAVASVSLVVVFWNVLQFYLILARGQVRTSVPFPFSLLIGLGLGSILWNLIRRRRACQRTRGYWIAMAIAFAVCIVGFPLAQMYCFGKTDYRRGADVIVVFGARAYANGVPSQALADRVRTACALYKDGLAPKLLFSGGPGDGPVHETESMRRLALSLGVRDQDILIDTAGLNSAATVANSRAFFERDGMRRVLVVSHFYHLPRIKMAYQRAGWNVYTVPARETRTLSQMPYLMLREVAALWVYYLGPLVRPA